MGVFCFCVCFFVKHLDRWVLHLLSPIAVISEVEARIWTPRVMQEFEKACWQVHVYSVSLWGATPNLYGFIHVARILYELKVYQHRRASQIFPCLL